MQKKRVALGLSGGVDSAVTAALLLEQGYDVTGVFIICYKGPGCRSGEDRKDALDVALKLNIPFEVLDYREAFQKKVLDYFKAEYEAGRTPNPDLLCNREIKFGLFYDWALRQARGKLGFDYVATGHYAKIADNQLQIPKDRHKDQTYFLYQLRQEQLEHILFPLGDLTKKEVREKAKSLGLSIAAKPDSVGICFVGEVSVRQFLEEMGLKAKEGKVVNNQGEIIGRHQGAFFYTMGQRHGFELHVKNPNTPALYVIDKNIRENTITVGEKSEGYLKEFEVENVLLRHDVGDKMQDLTRLQVRIRHGGELVECEVGSHGSYLVIHLTKPVWGVAPGQAAVFYKDGVCLGGGVISL